MLAMDIEQRQTEDITIVNVSGRLDSSVSGQLMDRLVGIVNSGSAKLIVNLQDLHYISSAGLRSILVAAKLIRSSGGELRLCQPSELVRKILLESGFSNLIRIDEDEAGSVAALQAS